MKEDTGLQMLSKPEVAKRLGMSVSWLDNSQSELARNIRASGIRYGRNQTSPIRYPLHRLLELLKEMEEKTSC